MIRGFLNARRNAMHDTLPPQAGIHHCRFRSRLSKNGWKSICTYIPAEHRIALEQLRRKHELKTLREALNLVLTSRFLPAYDVFASASWGRSSNIPCLTAK